MFPLQTYPNITTPKLLLKIQGQQKIVNIILLKIFLKFQIPVSYYDISDTCFKRLKF